MFTLKDNKPLFILDIAQNHMGSVEHGLEIIRRFYDVTQQFPYQFGFKMQYRNLDGGFIHPDYKNRMDFKYVKRFTETKLTDDEKKTLKDEMVKLGFISICTPYDESSVDLLEKHGYDCIKVASASFNDWALLERIVKTDKPIILSTAGASLEDMDKVVSFMEHRNKDFALMHCVAEYPTFNEHLQLNQIDLLKLRYPNVRIGYSTHETPDETYPIKIAIAKGATIFEKHVGYGKELNAYSARPYDIATWLMSAQSAYDMCGVKERVIGETKELFALRRGVFMNRDVKLGEQINNDDIFLAIPTFENQITANDLSKYVEFTTKYNIKKNEALLNSLVYKTDTRTVVYDYVKKVRALVTKSGVPVPYKVDVELSHHYGLDKFADYGMTIFTIVNREYCKKLLIMLPKQFHPEQFHQLKDETFNVLYGDVEITLDGVMNRHGIGDVITVNKGVKHSLGTVNGCVIEEISSTHYKDDSYYTDKTIMENKNRKTQLAYWMD
jgi:sialic acid synthase SpsE/mannose-6-phosphate isomerase-like protein (cupin superfamily)